MVAGPDRIRPEDMTIHRPPDAATIKLSGNDPARGTADSGPGWTRLPDKGTTDPNYNYAYADHGTSRDPYVLGTVKPDAAKLITDPKARYGRDIDTDDILSKTEYDERYVQSYKDWDRFPGNNGAAPDTIVSYTDPTAAISDYGPYVDRLGEPDGRYLSFFVEGTRPASFEERALPIGSLEHDHYQYKLTGTLPKG